MIPVADEVEDKSSANFKTRRPLGFDTGNDPNSAQARADLSIALLQSGRSTTVINVRHPLSVVKQTLSPSRRTNEVKEKKE